MGLPCSCPGKGRIRVNKFLLMIPADLDLEEAGLARRWVAEEGCEREGNAARATQ